MAERRPDRTLGPGHDEFWAWCDKGELRLQRCVSCAKISWPVVQACEYCGSADLIWDRMSGRGKIVSWCTFERDYYGGVLPVPWETILVELDEGPLFTSNPIGLTWRDIVADMPVKLSFIECGDRVGNFNLPAFGRA